MFPKLTYKAKLLSAHYICWDFLSMSNGDYCFGTGVQALNGFIDNLGLLFLVATCYFGNGTSHREFMMPFLSAGMF